VVDVVVAVVEDVGFTHNARVNESLDAKSSVSASDVLA
jgi:hypothetical protein